MEDTPIIKLLLKLAPPVMLALFIQSIYNIVDSYIYPIQLLMTALATGTGAGLNILISRMDGEGKTDIQHHIVKNGILTGIFNSLIFVIFGTLFIGIYYHISSNSNLVRTEGIQYAKIIFFWHVY